MNKTVPKLDYKERHQEEPQSAGLMFTESLKSFDQYISGNSRRLFAHPNVHVVIVVLEAVSIVGKDLTAHIMQRIWKDFWIVHAFIIFECNSEEVVLLI